MKRGSRLLNVRSALTELGKVSHKLETDIVHKTENFQEKGEQKLNRGTEVALCWPA